MEISKTILAAITTGVLIAGTTISCSKTDKIQTCKKDCTIEHNHVTPSNNVPKRYNCPACGMG